MTKKVEPDIQQASLVTMEDLRTILNSLPDEHVSELSLPEVEEIVNVVARVVPAGNVPGLIASGLARLQGKNPSGKEVKRDVDLLFRGMNHMLDHAVYNVFFAGPAQVIWGYQNILKLTGKDTDQAFPEGTWQFYVDYALREDTARHTNETDGFDKALQRHNIQLDDVDRMAAWVMTAIQTLHHYPQLLENEWRERVYIHELIKVAEGAGEKNSYQKLYNQWLAVLPYRRMADARGDETYPAYRRRKFDEWLFSSVSELPKNQKQLWLSHLKSAKEDNLSAYIEQMTIHSFLKPEQYAETRTAIPHQNLHVAIIHNDYYYLIPISEEDSDEMVDIEFVRGAIRALVQQPSHDVPAQLDQFAKIQRHQWDAVRRKLPKDLVEDLSMLRLCPIILNFNPRKRDQTLAEIRQAERGIGDHALTIFDTRESFVFDQSHIYFDGSWGAALAEIMTNEALAWASYLSQQAPTSATKRPYSPTFKITKDVRDYVSKLAQVIPEVSSENSAMRLDFAVSLRRIFKQRSDLLSLTVNDLLVLFRAIHAVTYEAHPDLVKQLKTLSQDKFAKTASDLALQALTPNEHPPAILIPVDASRQSPRDRLHPMSFQVPLTDLHLLQLHEEVMSALDTYESGQSGEAFDTLQRRYLAALAGFGEVMRRAKEIANAGESASVGSIKLLAHMPMPLQHLLNQIPSQFDMLNDIIKGREVFSNVGRVAKSSTLRRFITAKDDNEKKDLAWGVLTDADGTILITLRDFRPHVRALIEIGQYDLAQAMTQDYLNAYTHGFNIYVRDLQRITLKSRETRLAQ